MNPIVKKTALRLILAGLFVINWLPEVKAQDDLLQMLNEEQSKEPTYTIATFKASRLINGQTTETIAKKHLNFWISHRFGAVNSGFLANFFGLDEAKIRLGLEYGLTDNWLIGAGRSSLEKTYDFYTKYKVLRQSDRFPITVTGLAGWSINTMETGYVMESGSEMRFNNNLERYSYWGQVLISRKFNEKLSLQLMPSVVHFNKVEDPSISNNLMALGIGGRYKLTKRFTLSGEYYYGFSDPGAYEASTGKPYPYHNSLSIGVDIETGGHVFQLHFTNSKGMIEKQFIGQTVGAWEDGDIFYGFNIARTFSFDKSNKH
jgi:hypothetical protein